MRRAILLCAALAGAAASAAAQSSAPQAAPAAAEDLRVLRKVQGRTLTSYTEPRLRLKFDRDFEYVGGQSFVLYDVATAEQYFFVDADKGGRVRRLYWVQFEGYLPNNQHAYDYGSSNVVRIGGLDFVADSAARQIPPPDPALSEKPANKISDGDHARSFLASKGYTLASGEALWQRLVHLTDASKRSEVMIIYLEDLGGTGLRAADLNEGGSARARWESVSKGLLERARKGMKVTRR